MTLLGLRNELIAFRFNAGQATSIDYWINLAYMQLWGMEQWPWRKVAPESVTLNAGTIGTITPPTQMHRPLQLFDEDGYPLNWVKPKEFSAAYQSSTSNGTPADWTIYNGTIYVAPGPASSQSLSLSYLRRVAHYNGSAVDTAGVMSDDADYPIFPSEWHYGLVFGAMSLGQRLSNDPTYTQNEEAWQTYLQLLKSEFMPADEPEPSQYGALPWR